jgi:hypothetical protein
MGATATRSTLDLHRGRRNQAKFYHRASDLIKLLSIFLNLYQPDRFHQVFVKFYRWLGVAGRGLPVELCSWADDVSRRRVREDGAGRRRGQAARAGDAGDVDGQRAEQAGSAGQQQAARSLPAARGRACQEWACGCGRLKKVRKEKRVGSTKRFRIYLPDTILIRK